MDDFDEKEITINRVNPEKLKKAELTKDNKGKGKIKLTLKNIPWLVASALETASMLPFMQDIKTVGIANLTTHITTIIAKYIVYPAGIITDPFAAVHYAANTYGLIVATILSVVINHPLLVLTGGAALKKAITSTYHFLFGKKEEKALAK